MNNDFTEQVTTVLPIPTIPAPVVSGYMQDGYDLKLALILATMLGITAYELIQRCKQAAKEAQR